MAEYKNGFNAFGGVPVSPDKLSSDVRSGRAVYVDDTAYASDDRYKRNTNSKVYEGFHRETPIVVPEQSGTTPSASGDLSTAKLTVSFASEGIAMNTLFSGPILVLAPSQQLVIAPGSVNLPPGDYDVVLYQGKSFLIIGADDAPISVAGAIRDSEHGYIITGDCSVQIGEVAPTPSTPGGGIL